jgi:hypothetical protein
MKFAVFVFVCIALFCLNTKNLVNADVDDVLKQAQSGISQGWDKTKEVAGDGWDKTKQVAGDGWDKTKEVAGDGWDKTKELAGKAKDGLGSAVDSTKDALSKTGDDMKNLRKDMADGGSSAIQSTMSMMVLSSAFIFLTY